MNNTFIFTPLLVSVIHFFSGGRRLLPWLDRVALTRMSVRTGGIIKGHTRNKESEPQRSVIPNEACSTGIEMISIEREGAEKPLITHQSGARLEGGSAWGELRPVLDAEQDSMWLPEQQSHTSHGQQKSRSFPREALQTDELGFN